MGCWEQTSKNSVAMTQPQATTVEVGGRLVFVGGLHRSGTSLVTALLAGADGATGLVGTGFMEDEGHYLHDVVPSVQSFGGPGRFAFDARSHLIEADCVDPTGTRERLLSAWRPYWGNPEALIRVEKSPQNMLQTRYLQAAFADATFVIVVRHPAAVALATRKWTGIGPPGSRRFMPKRSLRSLLEHWVVAHDVFEGDRPRLERLHIVRFEDLVSNPNTLGNLCRAIGVEARPDGLRPPVSLNPTYRLQWRRWLRSPVGRHARNGWLTEMEPAIARWGYGVDDDF